MEFKKLSAAEQKAVREVSRKNLKNLVKQIQADNDQAIQLMEQNGLKVTPLPAGDELHRFHKVGEAVQKDLTGKLFDRKLLDQVLAISMMSAIDTACLAKQVLRPNREFLALDFDIVPDVHGKFGMKQDGSDNPRVLVAGAQF